MGQVIQIKGKVKFPITIDPGVWIFDDRKIDLDEFFAGTVKEEDEEVYEEKISKYWEREIREGSVSPPTLKTERKFEKEKVLTGTFGMLFEPFLNNAEPLQDATKLVIETDTDQIEVPIGEAKDLIFKFSHQGKPLKEDGPVHILYKDGSNLENPIKNVKGLTVK
mgnify:CR=1 FL=1